MSDNQKIDRRDFMRVTGAMAAGGAWLAAAESAAAAIAGPVFREVKRIPLTVSSIGALAVASDGTVYVALEDVIVVLNGDKETKRLPIKGTPACMAVMNDGRIAAGMRDHIELLDAQGKSVAQWKALGDRACLTSIAVDADNVYAADAGNRVVLRFDLEGKVLNEIGKRDKARDIPGLIIPSPYFDVAIDPQGALWVVNPGRHGLENYRPNGDLVSSWYRPGFETSGFCGCCNPIHVAFRSNCVLVTAEKGLNRIKTYSPDTTLLAVVYEPENLTDADKQALNCNFEAAVKDIAVDKKDRILVLSKPANALIVYDDKLDAPTETVS